MTTRHDLGRLRHSRRHHPGDRRLRLRPPRPGAVADVRRGDAPSRAAGQLSGADRGRSRRDAAPVGGCACRNHHSCRRARLRRHARRDDLVAAQPDRRSRSPSAVPGGRPRQGAPGRALRAGEGRSRARPARHRHQPDARPPRSPPTLRCPAEKITVAEPGTDPAERARGTGKPLQLLAVGSVVPRKAYDVLVRALASRDKAATGGLPSSDPPIAAHRPSRRCRRPSTTPDLGRTSRSPVRSARSSSTSSMPLPISS